MDLDPDRIPVLELNGLNLSTIKPEVYPMNAPVQMPGLLRALSSNPRYFTTDGERAVYLTGSHTWANLQDIGLAGGPPFPYEEYLDFMQSYGTLRKLFLRQTPIIFNKGTPYAH